MMVSFNGTLHHLTRKPHLKKFVLTDNGETHPKLGSAFW